MSIQCSTINIHPCVSYLGMHKSARVLDLITSLYFPIYEISHQDFFTYYPVLGFVEALVYQTDEAVEMIEGKEAFCQEENFWHQHHKIITEFLKEQNLYHSLVEQELKNLEEHYELKNQLILQKNVTHAEIIKAIELHTSDLRVLHAILVQMANKGYNQNAFHIMFPLEVILDIYDDIIHYQHDIEQNNYNTYRMFVKLYGNKAPAYLEAELARYESLFEEKLNKLPNKERKIYIKLVSELEKDSSVKTIPKPILE